MSLHTPASKPRGPVLINDDGIYGTFDGRPRLQDTSAAATNGFSSRLNGLLRVAAVAGLVLLAAGYMTNSGFNEAVGTVQHEAAAVAMNDDEVVAKLPVADLHQQFVDNVDASNMREYLHKYSSVPHSCGTEQDYKTALYTAEKFESFGIKAEIKEYYTLLSTPIRRRLAIVEPPGAARELNLTEASVPGDACTSDDSALPPFVAYAATGNVTPSIVFVNFGKQADFEWLVANNVTLEGKIAPVRYGGNFRGLKAMAAEQHGMVGVLIYSDPKEDGFVQGPVYPDGPWRPEGSFQRGSLTYLSLAAGDPTTPGWASVEGSYHIPYAEVETIPHIPALPLSYGQAQYILQSLDGREAPSSWQGGLSLPNGYRIGDDEATVVNLDIEIDNKVGPIWDVIGTIEGSEEPDELVLLGNHRDAWVCGAIDPNSGSSALLEIARGYGELLKQGWKPRRTLIFGSWDGEEYGLLGSTEYAEENAQLFKKQAVAYLNVDSMMGPLVSASGSPAIAEFLYQTAKDVPANKFDGNETEQSLYEQWTNQAAARRTSSTATKPSNRCSGSDYTAFYQHLGIISANLGFSLARAPYGVYHSSMDSIVYSELYADPNYATHVATAQWWGLLGLRLADNHVLPFDFTTYGFVMVEDLANLEQQVAALPRPDVDFSELRSAIARFTAGANTFHAQLTAFVSNETLNVDANAMRAWNQKLVLLERHLITEEGLPHRPWYKHGIFGPGFYEGYAGAAFPGISDAIAFYDDDETIQTHVNEVARIVNDAANYLLLAKKHKMLQQVGHLAVRAALIVVVLSGLWLWRRSIVGTESKRLKDFNLVRVLKRTDKELALLGTFKGDSHKKEAVLVIQTAAMDSGSLDRLLAGMSLHEILVSDTFQGAVTRDIKPYKVNLIYPATEAHVMKHTDQNFHMVVETKEVYETITKAFIDSIHAEKMQWVYNILDHKSESERIIYEDVNPRDGFILLPDFKWSDPANLESLYCLAIVHDRSLRSIRDLTASHLRLLRNIRDSSLEVLKTKYGVDSSFVRMYFHYQPTYYHLHVHFSHVKMTFAPRSHRK
ncbi:putative glutamate carboxypeptidase [Phytophthora fragariae]|uniref:Putative glutamate carboxypeptidase n=1 Tax=Phytophthora fragariae TaxID=53985 RepID=A0A6A3IXA5_9STRA|nr:putative glutamate carboxypeptidase [Phytophthora fragariae]